MMHPVATRAEACWLRYRLKGQITDEGISRAANKGFDSGCQVDRKQLRKIPVVSKQLPLNR